MVKGTESAKIQEINGSTQELRRLTTTVSLREIIAGNLRLEASAYNVEARQALKDLEESGLELRPLYGSDNALSTNAHAASRTKRIYVDEDHGIPFITSSEIISLRPRVENYISSKHTKKLDDFIVRKGQVLITRSGTIGNVTLAGNTLDELALSEDAIRVTLPDINQAGFVAAYLRSDYGRLNLRSSTYGSVVTHIEPVHLASIQIPWPHPVHINDIGRLFVEASEHRDEANRLLDNADARLQSILRLPHLKQLQEVISRSSSMTVRASRLDSRFEASFHDPLVVSIERALNDSGHSLTTLGDQELVKEIRPITKFRKRTYVEEGGIPLLSSKQLFQIDPIDVKKLARGAHTKDLKEIGLEPNMLAVTCSGTIGRVQIIPAYMKGWAANQHATRIIAQSDTDAGFLYAWLASDLGNKLIQRQSYGSVILEIDKTMLASILVPKLPKPQRVEIGEMVLRANALRDEAWKKEMDAIARINRLIKPIRVHTQAQKVTQGPDIEQHGFELE